MQREKATTELYKKLICDMIQDMTDARFLKQIYSIIVREYRKTGS